jgi:hypothetical protein
VSSASCARFAIEWDISLLFRCEFDCISNIHGSQGKVMPSLRKVCLTARAPSGAQSSLRSVVVFFKYNHQIIAETCFSPACTRTITVCVVCMYPYNGSQPAWQQAKEPNTSDSNTISCFECNIERIDRARWPRIYLVSNYTDAE